MNRAIKFRAKRVDNGQWIEGDLINSFEGVHISPDDYFKPSNGDKPDLYDVDPETVSQYTDFKDINGKEVFEGDILAMYHESEHKGLKPMDVNDTVTYEWGTPFLRTRYIPMYQFYHEMDGSFEVIGNVFDNHKL